MSVAVISVLLPMLRGGEGVGDIRMVTEDQRMLKSFSSSSFFFFFSFLFLSFLVLSFDCNPIF